MAYLGDRHPGTVEIEKRGLDFFEHGKRQGGRAGIEIVDTFMHGSKPPI
jgi:hypothetical protein